MQTKKFEKFDDKRIKRALTEISNNRKDILLKKRNKLKIIHEAEKNNQRDEVERLKREFGILNNKEINIDKNIKDMITSLSRQKMILQSKPSKDVEKTKIEIKNLTNKINYLQSLLKGKIPEKLKIETNSESDIKKNKFPVFILSATKKMISDPSTYSLNIDTVTRYNNGGGQNDSNIRDRHSLLKNIQLITRKIDIARYQFNSIEFREDRKKIEKEILNLEDQLKLLKRKLSNLESIMGLRTRDGGIPGARKKKQLPKSLKHGSTYLPYLNNTIYHVENNRKINEIRFLVISDQEKYDILLENNWFKRIGYKKDFAIGVAAPSGMIEFHGENSCDTYVDISDIASDNKEEIESRCKRYLNTSINTKFFYISDKIPFDINLKIICIIPIFQRRASTIEAVKRIKRQDVDIILVGSSSYDEQTAKIAGASYVEYNNTPLSSKIQVGIEVSRLSDPDAIMISGSDNWLSDNWISESIKYIGDYNVIGTRYWYAAKLQNKIPLEIIQCKYSDDRIPRREDPHGAGRIFTKSLLDKINWKLYDFKVNSVLDFKCWDRLKGMCKIKYKNLDNVISMGIKGDWQQKNSYDSLKHNSKIIKKTLESPESWLDSNFSDWNESFRKIQKGGI
jgi:hypothetical protein